jgi:hypothetical protein
MRGRLAWVLAGFGAVAAIARFLRSRPAAAPEHAPVPSEPEPDARADELRRRIDEAKGLEDERAAFEEAETPVDKADPTELDERRRHVHERARAALERMRGEPDSRT